MAQTSFRLLDDFIDQYKTKEPPFGFRDAGDNSVGELVFLRTYSRVKEDGTKERWWEVCRRVIEGMYSIQKDYALKNRLPWNANKAQASAKEAYERMFNLKFTPPGRGIHQMGGLQVIRGNASSLQNCAVVSTGDIDRHNPGYVFQWGMEVLMNGVGLGFDTLGKDKNIVVMEPTGAPTTFVVPDTREGWAESVALAINAYLRNNKPVKFDYSLVRPAGAPIKTFGGTASGPEPLKRLHGQIASMFDKRIGDSLDSEMITDIFNMIGACVVAGNVRRSAELALGEYDDEKFLELKNPEVFPDRNSYDKNSPGWAWASNNSINVPVGADYGKYVDRIASNGEPGFIWLDVTRSRGRMKDAPDDKDRRVVGFNPCVTADTYLFTDKGVITFGEAFASGKKQKILSDTRVTFDQVGEDNDPNNWTINVKNTGSEFVDSTHVFLTQKNADIVKVKTSNGISFRVTPDHLVATKRGMVAAEDLTNDDKVLVTPAPLPENEILEPDTLEEKEAFLMGLIAGDGTFAKTDTRETAFIDLWGDDRNLALLVKSWLEDIYIEYSDVYKSKGSRPFVAYYESEVESANKIRIASTILAAVLNDKYGFSKTTKHQVPKKFLTEARSVAARQYVAGLAFADGTVNLYSKVGSSSVRIAQSNRQMLSDIQVILLANGVSSSLYLRNKAGLHELPDGLGGTKMYQTKDGYEIVIMMHSYEYTKYFGFGSSIKQQLAEQTFNSPSKKKNAYSQVVSVEYDGREDVYCLTEPKRHTIVANGVTMRNCAEQPLESFEMCTLTTVHLPNMESKEDFLRTLKFAFLYAKTVTLLATPWPETNAVMQRNRRIGLSITGITDILDTHGMPEIIKYMDEGYEEIRRWDKIYSEWLCVRESNRVTTIKPEGTVSLLSGSSPGVHWGPGGKYFLRAIRFGSNDELLHLFRAAGYSVEDDVVSSDTSVVYFPVKSNSKRSEKDVTILEKIGLAAKAQHHWSDNGVSVTVSFNKDSEKDLIVPALRLHEGQIKSVSFLPMDNTYYPQMPYTEITEEEYESYIGKIKKIDFSAIYDGVSNLEAIGEKFCSNDSCTI